MNDLRAKKSEKVLYWDGGQKEEILDSGCYHGVFVVSFGKEFLRDEVTSW